MEVDMIYTAMTKMAMKLCFEVHKNQVDKTGLPYVFHPFHLAEQMDDEISTVCALLHDVVEDSDTTFEDLLEMGFSGEIIDVLKLLTHAEEVPYMDYVREIKKNPTATKVKIADLKHNSDTTRLDVVDEWAIKRNEKYAEALRILTE
jgi:(p)ppGpp synthase/HD superfamily hydrolase